MLIKMKTQRSEVQIGKLLSSKPQVLTTETYTVKNMAITQKQQDVLDLMPATRDDIADELGISYRAVRYRMNKIEDQTDINFERDDDYVWSVSDGESKREEPKRVKTYNKAQNTKDVHNELTELEKDIKEALNNANPVISNYERTEGKSTLVLPHSDAHVGAVIKDRYDVDYYAAEEAKLAIREYVDRGIQHANKRGNVEDVVFVLNGDLVDGEGIYPGQRHGQEDNIRDQLRKAGHTYIEEILKLSDNFEHVDVYCIPGNHGRLDRESTTNFDDMLYDFVETAISYSDVDNVNIEKAGPGGFLNFDVRGWTYHSRHGDKYLKHVGTSSGQNRVKDDWMKYQFDILLRSHYHKTLLERIGDEIPIVMLGSPAPPSTFAESLGADGGRSGVFWFTTENKVIEDFQPIRIET